MDSVLIPFLLLARKYLHRPMPGSETYAVVHDCNGTTAIPSQINQDSTDAGLDPDLAGQEAELIVFSNHAVRAVKM